MQHNGRFGLSVRTTSFKGWTNCSGSPLERNITREEVGSAGMLLLSDHARGITGEILHVDCGYNVMGSPGRAIEKAKKLILEKV